MVIAKRTNGERGGGGGTRSRKRWRKQERTKKRAKTAAKAEAQPQLSPRSPLAEAQRLLSGFDSESDPVLASPRSQAEAKAAAKAEAEVKASAKAEAEVKASAKAEAEVKASAKAEAEVKASAKAEAEAKAVALAEAKARAVALAEAKARATQHETEQRARTQREEAKDREIRMTRYKREQREEAKDREIRMTRYEREIRELEAQAVALAEAEAEAVALPVAEWPDKVQWRKQEWNVKLRAQQWLEQKQSIHKIKDTVIEYVKALNTLGPPSSKHWKKATNDGTWGSFIKQQKMILGGYEQKAKLWANLQWSLDSLTNDLAKLQNIKRFFTDNNLKLPKQITNNFLEHLGISYYDAADLNRARLTLKQLQSEVEKLQDALFQQWSNWLETLSARERASEENEAKTQLAMQQLPFLEPVFHNEDKFRASFKNAAAAALASDAAAAANKMANRVANRVNNKEFLAAAAAKAAAVAVAKAAAAEAEKAEAKAEKAEAKADASAANAAAAALASAAATVANKGASRVNNKEFEQFFTTQAAVAVAEKAAAASATKAAIALKTAHNSQLQKEKEARAAAEAAEAEAAEAEAAAAAEAEAAAAAEAEAAAAAEAEAAAAAEAEAREAEELRADEQLIHESQLWVVPNDYENITVSFAKERQLLQQQIQEGLVTESAKAEAIRKTEQFKKGIAKIIKAKRRFWTNFVLARVYAGLAGLTFTSGLYALNHFGISNQQQLHDYHYGYNLNSELPLAPRHRGNNLWGPSSVGSDQMGLYALNQDYHYGYNLNSGRPFASLLPLAPRHRALIPLDNSNQQNGALIPLDDSNQQNGALIPLDNSNQQNGALIPLDDSNQQNGALIPLDNSNQQNGALIPLDDSNQQNGALIPLFVKHALLKSVSASDPRAKLERAVSQQQDLINQSHIFLKQTYDSPQADQGIVTLHFHDIATLEKRLLKQHAAHSSFIINLKNYTAKQWQLCTIHAKQTQEDAEHRAAAQEAAAAKKTEAVLLAKQSVIEAAKATAAQEAAAKAQTVTAKEATKAEAAIQAAEEQKAAIAAEFDLFAIEAAAANTAIQAAEEQSAAIKANTAIEAAMKAEKAGATAAKEAAKAAAKAEKAKKAAIEAERTLALYETPAIAPPTAIVPANMVSPPSVEQELNEAVNDAKHAKKMEEEARKIHVRVKALFAEFIGWGKKNRKRHKRAIQQQENARKTMDQTKERTNNDGCPKGYVRVESKEPQSYSSIYGGVAVGFGVAMALLLLDTVTR